MQFRHQRGPTADLLQLGGEILLTALYARRRALLAELPVISTRVVVPRHFTAEDIDPHGLLAVVEEQGLEGLVAKRLESRYHPGQRSRDWPVDRTTGRDAELPRYIADPDLWTSHILIEKVV